jgi:hypothetical protein
VTDRPWLLVEFESLPPAGEVAELQLPDGKEILGWRVFDSILRRNRYWRWAEGDAVPSKADTVFGRAGVVEVFPVKWRTYEPSRFELADPQVSRREAEVILMRTLKADGFRRATGEFRGVKTTRWPDAEPEWNEAYGRHAAKVKWKPEGFDWDNYLIAMRWYLDLSPDEQRAIRWYVVGKPFWFIGERLGVSGEAARKCYNRAVEKAWGFAIRDQAQLRRLSKTLWDHARRHP